jgi:hypothetical protein
MHAMIACTPVPIAAFAVLIVAIATTQVVAQPAGRRGVSEDDAAFVEALRREDPDSAARFVALREAQASALADLERARARYRGGGAELRGVSLPALVQARRRYAEASLALLDFLDTRDRQAITRLQNNVERITRGLEERAQNRAQLERMLRGD